MIKNSDDDYEDERIVNLTAVLVGLINNNQSFKNDFLDATENTYEIQYNKACIMIASKKYDTAIKKLNEAEGINFLNFEFNLLKFKILFFKLFVASFWRKMVQVKRKSKPNWLLLGHKLHIVINS